MDIKQAYRKYKIPPNLQLHMKRAAAVGAFIIDHWSSQTALLEREIIEALLLHDMGNIIKFDFRLSHLLGEEEKNLEYWKSVQADFKQKWGNEHIATMEIAKEIGISEKTLKLLEQMGSSNLSEVFKSGDWSAKISCYCDFRVSPTGIVSVNQRFDELIERYHGRTHDLGDVAKTQARRAFCLDLEGALQEKVNFDLNKLTDLDITKYLKVVEAVQL